MTTAPSKSAQAANGGSGKRSRRSDRFPATLSVEARWALPGGSLAVERGTAAEINAHGSVLKLARYPEPTQPFDLTNLVSGETTQARGIGPRKCRDGSPGFAIELQWPSETFWGISYRLQKASAELLRLGQVLGEGEMDLRVLRDFRDAVDYVRKTAWAVNEWHDRKARQHDTATVLPLLTRERIRRCTQLCSDILKDVQAAPAPEQCIAEHRPELDALLRSILLLHAFLSRPASG
jgi:hypothetical protein